MSLLDFGLKASGFGLQAQGMLRKLHVSGPYRSGEINSNMLNLLRVQGVQLH